MVGILTTPDGTWSASLDKCPYSFNNRLVFTRVSFTRCPAGSKVAQISRQRRFRREQAT
jgi:hypothetical protein